MRVKPVFGIFVLAVLVTVRPVSAQTLVLATDDTPGEPYIMGGGRDFHPVRPGIEIELYREVARELGLTVTFRRMPWKRCLKEIQAGRVDGVFPASYKPEREALGCYPMKNGAPDPSRKTRDSAYCLYRRSGSSVSWNGESFVHLADSPKAAIGVPLGWAIGEDLRKMGVPLVEKTYPRDLLVMLASGGLAGVVCLDSVIDAYLADAAGDFAQIEKAGPPVSEKHYYLIFSHDFAARHSGLPEAIWDRIARIKQSSAYRTIVTRYTR